MTSYDYVLVGGGLQSALIALAVRECQPSATVAVIEREPRLGGNHTWCFHEHDVGHGARSWVEPLVAHRWSGYEVRIAGSSFQVDDEYACVTSDRLHSVVTAALTDANGCAVRTGEEAVEIDRDRVVLASGEMVRGTLVVDARGPSREPPAGTGYQSFLGLELELDEPHGLDRAILMDVTEDQSEGYRFFYLLPFGPRTVLVEDTYFNRTPGRDAETLRARVHAYVEARGWAVRRVLREERGILPMPWRERLQGPGSGPLRAGYRGGWYHAGTGYSFPVAARLAEFIADRPAAEVHGRELTTLWRSHRRQARFAMFLNRLLFRWYPPERRKHVFERFYRLPPETIRNFYCLQLTSADRARLLGGAPPEGLSLSYRLTRKGDAH